MDKIVILSRRGKRDEPLIALLEAVFPECEIDISPYINKDGRHSVLSRSKNAAKIKGSNNLPHPQG